MGWLFGWQGRFETCPYVSGALAWIGGIGVGCLGLPRSAPRPHPNPLPPSGRGEVCSV